MGYRYFIEIYDWFSAVHFFDFFQVKAKILEEGSESVLKPNQILVEKSLTSVKDLNGLSVATDRAKSAREAVERAKTHNFGDLLQRFSQDAILAMVDNGARENPKAFLDYGMIRPCTFSKRGRPTYECNMPECNGMMLNEGNNAIYHCLRGDYWFYAKWSHSEVTIL